MVRCFLSSIVTMLIPFVLYTRVVQNESTGWMLFAGIFLLGMIVLQIYLFRFVCSSKIENDVLVMKKLLRSVKQYSFEKIRELKTIRIENTIQIAVKMQKEDAAHEKYLIVNSKSIFLINEQTQRGF